MKKTILSATFAALALSPLAHAAVIITPTGATSTSTNDGTRVIGKTIDGDGLSGGGTSGNILSETHSLNTSNTGPYWLSANGGGNAGNTTTLTFNLGGTFEVNGVHMWTYDRLGDNPTRAIESFDISFSTNGGTTYGGTINLSGWLASNEAGYAQVNGQIPVQSRAFAAVSGVTHIKMDSIVNHGNAFIGMSEIRFNAVPEPSTAFLGGLGFLFLLRRRR